MIKFEFGFAPKQKKVVAAGFTVLKYLSPEHTQNVVKNLCFSLSSTKAFSHEF
jgi:hypothetical protein